MFMHTTLIFSALRFPSMSWTDMVQIPDLVASAASAFVTVCPEERNVLSL